MIPATDTGVPSGSGITCAAGQTPKRPKAQREEYASDLGLYVMELDVQVARSDWYEQAVEKLAIGSYLITPVYLPTARRPGRPRSGT